jgi:hypothetical protein
MVQDLPDRSKVVFDDERVVVNAGIVLAVKLGRRLGMEALVDAAVRMHGWAPGLAGNATYFDGEIPRRSMRGLPRFVDEFVMGQIESEDNFVRLPDLTTQTAIVLLFETGLRSVDALRLPFDPITVDGAGAP